MKDNQYPELCNLSEYPDGWIPVFRFALFVDVASFQKPNYANDRKSFYQDDPLA